MQCKNCLIWRQTEEQTRERLANLTIDTARFLGKEVNNPTIVEQFRKSLNRVYDWLDRRWRKLIVEIGDMECRQGRCILCDLGEEEA